MSNQLKNTLSEQEQQEIIIKLNNLDKDLESIENRKSKEINIFDAIGMIKQETKHSHFLAWLLDRNNNHCLDNALLSEILDKVYERSNNQVDVGAISNKDILSKIYVNKDDFVKIADEKNIVVKTELVCDGFDGRSDIVVSLKDITTNIVIENKVEASLHDEQLTKYEKYFNKNYKDWNNIYIFLSPFGKRPIEAGLNFDKWCVLSYEDILELLMGLIKDKKVTKQKLKYIMEDYIEMVKTNILMENKDIIEACRKIYNKHSETLELLRNYTDNTAEIMNFCKNYIKSNGFVEIIENSQSNTQFYFLSNDLFNKFGGETFSNSTSVRFSYRIAIEDANNFQKIIFFKKKSEHTSWATWQKEYYKALVSHKELNAKQECSVNRQTIVTTDIVHGYGKFDDAQKTILQNELDKFISEIRDFEYKTKNININ